MSDQKEIIVGLFELALEELDFRGVLNQLIDGSSIDLDTCEEILTEMTIRGVTAQFEVAIKVGGEVTAEKISEELATDFNESPLSAEEWFKSKIADWYGDV